MSSVSPVSGNQKPPQQQQQHQSNDEQKSDLYHTSNLTVAPSSLNLTSSSPLATKLDTVYNTSSKMPSPLPDVASSINEIYDSAAINDKQQQQQLHQQQQTLNKSAATATTTFDYLYEFSETRKVLEDFFKCPNNDEEKKINECFNESDTGSFVSTCSHIIIAYYLSLDLSKVSAPLIRNIQCIKYITNQ